MLHMLNVRRRIDGRSGGIRANYVVIPIGDGGMFGRSSEGVNSN